MAETVASEAEAASKALDNRGRALWGRLSVPQKKKVIDIMEALIRLQEKAKSP